jgi:hypothetical protein
MVYAQAQGRTTERFGDDEVTWIARVDSIVPERLPEFGEVRARLVEAWRQQQQSEQLQTVAAEIEAAVADGTATLETEAAKYNAAVENLSRAISRQDTTMQLPRPLMAGLFSADQEGDTFSLPGMSGQMIIMQVTDIDRPASETLDLLAQASALEIQSSIEADLNRAFLISISETVELETNVRALDAYKRSLVTEQ